MIAAQRTRRPPYDAYVGQRQSRPAALGPAAPGKTWTADSGCPYMAYTVTASLWRQAILPTSAGFL